MMNESSKTHLMRNTPKRELAPLQRDPHMLIDPEKLMEFSEDRLNSTRRMKELSAKSMIDNENGEGMNITFYNAKSNCLPPINCQNI
jgi:hypothetical protein